MALSKEESLEILSLAEGASVQEIENKYNELYSDFQIRLTNAPTPNLKKLYQKNLQDLEEAYELLRDGSSPSPSGDLPSSRPVIDNPSPQSKAKKRATSVPQKQNVTAGRTLKSTKSAKTSGINLTTFIIVIVVGLAGISLLASLYYEGKGEVENMRIEAEKNAEFLELKNYIKNGRFRVENRTNDELLIQVTHVTFLDAEGKLTEYKFLGGKNYPRPVTLTLQPGKTVNLNQYDGPIKWDGSVVSYCMLVYQKNKYDRIYAAFSGIWLHEWPENKLVITN